LISATHITKEEFVDCSKVLAPWCKREAYNRPRAGTSILHAKIHPVGNNGGYSCTGTNGSLNTLLETMTVTPSSEAAGASA